ncbi:MAG: glycosyltransferase family 2 protein [archaeon]
MVAISVVITSWNAKGYLEKCLTSIFEDPAQTDHEIIVIDNGSTDGTAAMLSKFSGIKLIRNKKNRTIAQARNQGMKMARGRYIMMLDADTIVLPNCFERIVEFMDSHIDAWGAGTKTLNPNGTLQPNCRTFYTLPIILFRRTPMGRLFPENRYVRNHLMLDWDHNDDRQVDWVAGASLVMRREAIDKIGPLDEGYLYCVEDTDWCYRVMLSGHNIWYISDAKIIHHVQRNSAKLLSWNAYEHMRSALRFYWKFYIRNRNANPTRTSSRRNRE